MWVCCVIALLAGIVVSGCGSTSHARNVAATVDASRVATAIQVSVQRERGVHASVTCPTGVPLRVGVTFYCVAQNNTNVTPFEVTEAGGVGHVTYVGVSPSKIRLVSTTQVARAIVSSIKSTRHLDAVVKCPTNIPVQTGLPFACTATTKSGEAHFEVVQADGGHLAYRVL